MESRQDKLQRNAMISALRRFDGWDELKQAIDHEHSDRVEELVSELMKIMNNRDETYIKRTIEIRKELVQRLQEYCVRHGYKQKQVVNLALDILLTMEEDKE